MNNIITSEMPEPDESGAAGTQTAQTGEVMAQLPDSPISLGHVASGLAADSNSGLNKQASLMLTADYLGLQKKHEEADEQLKKMLPEVATLRERLKNLDTNKRKGAIVNLIGTIILPVGAGMASSSDSSSNSTGWMLVLIGGALCLIDIIPSLFNKNRCI